LLRHTQMDANYCDQRVDLYVCLSVRLSARWHISQVSCCRQNLLDNLCDKLQRSSVGARMYYQLSWPTTVQFITLWASTFLELSWQHASAIDTLCETFEVQSSEQSSRGKYPYFWRYLNFLTTHCRIGGKKTDRQTNHVACNIGNKSPHECIARRRCDLKTVADSRKNYL